MAKGKDPAFLFYPADASEDTQFMNRLERGCYFDLLKAQKKFRKFHLPLIQKVLGQDFKQCWPAIESVLEKDGDAYFIGWVDDAIENRAEHSAKQKKRIQEYWNKKKQTEQTPDSFHGNTTEQPKQTSGNTLENENETVNENAIIKEIRNAVVGSDRTVNDSRETDLPDLDDYTQWTEQMVDGNDRYFEVMLRNENIPESENLIHWINDHRDLLNRYPKMKPPNQQAFRQSCLKHVRENYKKTFNGNGTNKKQQQTASTAQYVADYYTEKLGAGKAKPNG